MIEAAALRQDGTQAAAASQPVGAVAEADGVSPTAEDMAPSRQRQFVADVAALYGRSFNVRMERTTWQPREVGIAAVAAPIWRLPEVSGSSHAPVLPKEDRDGQSSISVKTEPSEDETAIWGVAEAVPPPRRRIRTKTPPSALVLNRRAGSTPLVADIAAQYGRSYQLHDVS